MKDMGYKFAFRGGLSFSLGDIRIPDQKPQLIADAREQVEGISANYNMGLVPITNVTTKLLMYGLQQMRN
jgi:DNA-directed RNA polymerase subunit beta'